MASGRIQQRIDPELQKKAETILKMMGIKPSQAIAMFYMEITRRRNLPFHPSPVRRSETPNAKLQKAIREARSGRGVQKFNSAKEMFDALGSL